MSDDFPDFPEGTIQEKQAQLREAILSNPEDAWYLLQEDPVMIVAFTKVRRDLEKSETEDANEFFEQYYKKVNLILSEDAPLERYGIALTAEFVTEVWRQSKNDTQLSSINEALLKKLALLMEAVDMLPESADQKVIHQIVDYSANRIIDFADYDRMKAREHLAYLSSDLQDLVQSAMKGGIDDRALALMYFAASSTEGIEVLRDHLAHLLKEELETGFNAFEEEDKFKVAPWLGVFRRIVEKTDRVGTKDSN